MIQAHINTSAGGPLMLQTQGMDMCRQSCADLAFVPYLSLNTQTSPYATSHDVNTSLEKHISICASH